MFFMLTAARQKSLCTNKNLIKRTKKVFRLGFSYLKEKPRSPRLFLDICKFLEISIIVRDLFKEKYRHPFTILLDL